MWAFSRIPIRILLKGLRSEVATKKVFGIKKIKNLSTRYHCSVNVRAEFHSLSIKTSMYYI